MQNIDEITYAMKLKMHLNIVLPYGFIKQFWITFISFCLVRSNDFENITDDRAKFRQSVLSFRNVNRCNLRASFNFYLMRVNLK